MNIFISWLNFMKWGLIIIPPLMVVTFLVVPFVDLIRPWSVGESELDQYGRTGPAICVGISTTHSRTPTIYLSESQRSYLLITKRELVTITKSQRNSVSNVSIDSSKWGFWILPSVFVLFVLISLRVSIPRIKTKLCKQNNPHRATRYQPRCWRRSS